MRKLQFPINALVAVLFTLAFITVAQAQAPRTWVSGVGDDVNPCSRTAPCKSFAGAISKTAVNGEINCLDPGGFGAVTITKSITIDCHEIFAAISNPAANGITIAFDSFDPADARRSVRLRNLNLNGQDTGLIGINITGDASAPGSKVFIEDCLLDGNAGGTARGILDTRSAGGTLVINNTTIRNMASSGISVGPLVGLTGSAVSITNSRVAVCLFGIAVANGVRVTTSNSVYVSNGTGIRADAGPTPSQIGVENCTVSNNNTAFVATFGSQIFVGGSTAMNNGTLGTVVGTGVVSSYGDNHTGGLPFPSPNTFSN